MRHQHLLILVALLAAATVACAQTTTATNQFGRLSVDPAGPALTNYSSLGEWNTDGSLDGWSTAQISGATVSGGLLAGAASGADPQLTLLHFAGGPDLDLGYYDFIDLRLQVPAAFSGAIQFYFGVTNTPGISSSRLFTISNSFIPQDGAFHVYRMFIGPQVYWRGNLRDVRLDPLGASAVVGQAFAVDYLRAGDLAGDTYLHRYSVNIPGPGTNDSLGFPVFDLESKHFRVVWDVSAMSNAYWNANIPHGTLRNLEEVWKTHIWRLGLTEPSQSWTPANRDGHKYKVNLTMYYGGYWTGGDAGDYPWINITPDGLQVDPPTWVPPHEFTHACQMVQSPNGAQNMDGQFWENHANYAREQWLYYYPWYPNTSNLDPNYPYLSHFWIAHGRDYYLCWPFWLYLDENPDNLPGLGSSYGSFFTSRPWQTEPAGQYLWQTIANLAPAVSVADLLGCMARRNVTWDYSHKSALQAAYNAGDQEIAQRWTYAELHRRADDPTWWQTPLDMAPQQTGYKIHQLIPQGSGAGRLVGVNFHGLPNAARGADWRASLVVVSDSGAVRYSTLWNAGSNSVTLAANENTLYLSVAGTPAPPFLTESIDDSLQPYPSDPARARFPYEMQISGAVPKESTNGSTAGLIQVANGGGWRAGSATVEAGAYVAPNARVLGSARVRNNARILDCAIVEGSAQVLSNAVVSGHALVRNAAIVTGHAKVRDYATILNNSVVDGYARVLEHGQMTGGTNRDWATIKGTVSTWYDPGVNPASYTGGDAVLDGDFSTAQPVTNGFQFGFEEYNPGPLAWITNRTAPRRLYAAYECNAPHDSLLKDCIGATDGYLSGSPVWMAGDGQRSGFLAFNGTNYVILDKSLSDLAEITVAAWVKWSGGAPGQPVWYFGSQATNYMYLTPDDGTGHAKFVIQVNGGTPQTLAAPGALPVGVWTHVAVTLSNSVAGALWLNGAAAAAGAITLTPDQLNAPNVNTIAQQNYLARGEGSVLPFYRGAIDSFRVYTGPLTAAEIAALGPQTAPVGTGTLYVDLRATNAAAANLATYPHWTNLGPATIPYLTRSASTAYTASAAGTGLPAVQLTGSSSGYTSPAFSIADITGSSDRSIEVWAFNPSFQDEETLVSLGDRTGTRKDLSINYSTNTGWGAVTHFGDDLSWSVMGVPVSNAWHHLAYTYDGSVTARIYVDGFLWQTHTLGGVLATPGGDIFSVGMQHDGANTGPDKFFTGYINAVRVWGGVLTPSQVASNYALGPWTLPSTAAVSLAPLSDATINAGVTLRITNSATDPNLPPLPLAYSLPAAPAGAAINASTGVFTWRPSVLQAGTVNTITVTASDNMTPALTASQNFHVTVNPLPPPSLAALSWSNGQFSLQVTGAAGPDYSVQTSTDLIDWTSVFTTNSPALPLLWTDPNSATHPAAFYRVILGP